MQNMNPIRGTYDYLPNVARVREQVRQKILASYQANGYNLIETPILEHLELLNSSEGGDNLRLMFKTIKRDKELERALDKERELALAGEPMTEDELVAEGLRYDLTVPLVRFYSNNRDKLPTPFKALQIGYAFRAERPQKGRNRQFVQCDIDVFGDPSINAEIELLKTCLDTLNDLGFDRLTLKINHKQLLNSLILNAGFTRDDLSSVCVTLDKIDKISLNGVMMELIEKGFEMEKINRLADIISEVQSAGLKSCLKYGVDEQVVADLDRLISALRSLTNSTNNIVFDVSIVRGQGYYTGAVYEIYQEGFAGAVTGGGRYDNMVEKFTGTPCPVVGVSIGFEPICMLLSNGGSLSARERLALIYEQTDDIVEVLRVKDELKKKYDVSIYARPKNVKNLYEKLASVVDLVTSMRDYAEGKEFKRLTTTD